MRIWQFAAAVANHWIAVLGGPVIAVGLFMWQQFGGPNVPRWIFWALAVGSVFVGAYRAWNTERLRADGVAEELRNLRQDRPSATLRIVVDGPYLLVQVQNDGAGGNFTATVETDGDRPLQPMPAIWDLTNSHEPYEIPSGAFGRVRIASVNEERRPFYTPDGEEIGPDYGWEIFYHRLPGHRGWHAGRRDIDAPDETWFTVRAVVRSQPHMESGSVSKRFRLIGRHAVDLDSGERFAPRVVAMEDEYDKG